MLFLTFVWRCLLIFVCFVRVYTIDLYSYGYLRIVRFFFKLQSALRFRKRSISFLLLLLQVFMKGTSEIWSFPRSCACATSVDLCVDKWPTTTQHQIVDWVTVNLCADDSSDHTVGKSIQSVQTVPPRNYCHWNVQLMWNQLSDYICTQPAKTKQKVWWLPRGRDTSQVPFTLNLLMVKHTLSRYMNSINQQKIGNRVGC